MRTDALQALRACDPAAGFAPTAPEDRERLIRLITSGPYDGAAQKVRRRRRRLVLIAVAVGLLLLLAATAVYAGSYLLEPIDKGPNPPMSDAQWRAAYDRWTHQIPLPPGEHWRDLRNPDGTIFGAGAGHVDVTWEAIGHWTKAWVAATASGDVAHAAEAEQWVTRLFATIPVITEAETKAAFGSKYGTESMAGDDEAEHRYWAEAIAAARQGRFTRLIRLSVGMTYRHPAPAATPSPTHYHGMESSGDSGTLLMTADEVWAEYQDVLSQVGTPPGLDAERAHRQVLASGSTYFGGGFERGFEDAWAGWWKEWARAAKAHDAAGVHAASAATQRLQDLLPHTISAHGRYATFYYQGDPKRDLAELSARARAGDMSGIEEWLAFQAWYHKEMHAAAGYEELKVLYDGPSHQVTWRSTPDAPVGQATDAAAAAEYAAAQRLIDLPAGVSWPAWPPAGTRVTAGAGFERAVDFAWLSWWRAWIAAGEAGDQSEVANAERASRRIHALLAGGLPLAAGARIEASSETLLDFERLDARARRGDLGGLRDWSTYQAVSGRGIGTAGP